MRKTKKTEGGEEEGGEEGEGEDEGEDEGEAQAVTRIHFDDDKERLRASPDDD